VETRPRELMRAKFEKPVAFALVKLLEVEGILVEGHCFRHMADLDCNAIAAVNLPARDLAYSASNASHALAQRRHASAQTRQCSILAAWLSHLAPQISQA
jgi:hypothetical protein